MCRELELLECVDAELVVDAACKLGADAGNTGEDGACVGAALEPLEQAEAAPLDELADRSLELVAAHAKRVGLLQARQLGHALQLLGDLLVAGCGAGGDAAATGIMRRHGDRARRAPGLSP